MHQPVKERLEDYLQGRRDGDSLVEFHTHLASCPECNAEVVQMNKMSKLFEEIRAPKEAEPAPGFYARVLQRIDEQREVSIWAVFLEPVFGRRLLYASLMFVLLLGSVIFTTEREDTTLADLPEVVQPYDTQFTDFDEDPAPYRDTTLVHLTTYQE